MDMLVGKTIIVAGATGGIGEGVTKLLLRHGATVVALSRTEDKLQGLAAYLSNENTDRLIPLQANLDQEQEGTRELQRRLLERFGPFDGAVIAIGNWGHANNTVVEVSDELWSQTLNDNVTSHFRALRTLVPMLKPDGALVHISGLSADGPYPGAGVIAMTNAAKKSLVLTLAAEQESTGPRVYELIVGPIRTRERVTRGVARASWYDPEDVGEFISEIVVGRTQASRHPLHYMVQRGS